jgi:hypothetical protein
MWRGGACGNRRLLDGHDDTAPTGQIEKLFPGKRLPWNVSLPWRPSYLGENEAADE